jgi:hypothetical protein
VSIRYSNGTWELRDGRGNITFLLPFPPLPLIRSNLEILDLSTVRRVRCSEHTYINYPHTMHALFRFRPGTLQRVLMDIDEADIFFCLIQESPPVKWCIRSWNDRPRSLPSGHFDDFPSTETPRAATFRALSVQRTDLLSNIINKPPFTPAPGGLTPYGDRDNGPFTIPTHNVPGAPAPSHSGPQRSRTP